MRIEMVYEKKYLIPEACEGNFRKKTTLSTVEKIGLEAIAAEFLLRYEEECGVQVTVERLQELRDFIRWNENSLDILD